LSERHALVLGCGYVGLALARRLRIDGVRVTATSRSEARFGEIRDAGAQPVVADVMNPETLRPLAKLEPTVVFDLVRPQRIDEGRYTGWGTRNVAAVFEGTSIEALVYLSSTSVYGRRSGEWTDESTPVDPVSPVGTARVEAERIYLDAFRESGLPVRICRVPGIYGPGRTLRQRLESGAYRRVDDEELWISRIHVDDLVDGLAAAWTRGRDGEIYLLCDDEPMTAQEYAELTAQLLSLPLPPTVDREDIRQELSSDAFERRISARRCSNRRMRQELGVELRFPSAKLGVPAALEAEGAI
jgi:nucleoside-diphosphate-sugar epimerase